MREARGGAARPLTRANRLPCGKLWCNKAFGRPMGGYRRGVGPGAWLSHAPGEAVRPSGSAPAASRFGSCHCRAAVTSPLVPRSVASPHGRSTPSTADCSHGDRRPWPQGQCVPGPRPRRAGEHWRPASGARGRESRGGFGPGPPGGQEGCSPTGSRRRGGRKPPPSRDCGHRGRSALGRAAAWPRRPRSPGLGSLQPRSLGSVEPGGRCLAGS